jgi:hypothetical protein
MWISYNSLGQQHMPDKQKLNIEIKSDGGTLKRVFSEVDSFEFSKNSNSLFETSGIIFESTTFPTIY